MFKALFALHLLGAALLVGWVVFDGVLRLRLSRVSAPQERAGLIGLSIAFLSALHAGIALALLTGFLMLMQSGLLRQPPPWIAVKEIVMLGIVLVLIASARSVRRLRTALPAAGEGDSAGRELDAAFARTGMWMRLLGLGALLNFGLGVLRPGT